MKEVLQLFLTKIIPLIKKSVNQVVIVEMYPRIPREMVVNPFGNHFGNCWVRWTEFHTD